MKSKLSEKKKTSDPAKWTPVRRFVGLALAVFALLALVGCLSYLFSWRQDQSSLADPALFGADVQVSNKGSKVGLSIASLLVGRWFGLGAFAVVFAMAVLAARLFFGKQRFSVIRMVLLSVTGAVLLSFILAYFSVLSGLENSFGGGLGGECGAHAVLWIENMVGPLVTFFILLFLCALWLYFSSEGFSSWFNSVGTSHPDEAKPEKKKESELIVQKTAESGRERGPEPFEKRRRELQVREEKAVYDQIRTEEMHQQHLFEDKLLEYDKAAEIRLVEMRAVYYRWRGSNRPRRSVCR